MKRIVSISLGSSRRNHKHVLEAAGEKVELERIGTDGDVNHAIRLVRELDGKVDAIGLGGISMYLYAAGRRYILDEARRIASYARQTPVVDGAGIKHTVEGRLAAIFEEKTGERLIGRKALIVSAVERYPMAESLLAAGCRLVIGDLIFALGLPIPLYSLRTLDRVGKALLPLICRLPIKLVYPTGSKQEEETSKKATRYLEEAEVLAGDFHYIRRFLPEKLDGKVIISNTVTQADRKVLADRGASWLVTASPELGGRSFATNILDALVVAVSGQRPEELTAADYEYHLRRLSLDPRVENLQS
ncbi:MAG: quinate 5-dehydrogenase [Firmicutes bacterium]|nr:quinate 5-dehydrogenase [Bacillota bacterium]